MAGTRLIDLGFPASNRVNIFVMYGSLIVGWIIIMCVFLLFGVMSATATWYFLFAAGLISIITLMVALIIEMAFGEVVFYGRKLHNRWVFTWLFRYCPDFDYSTCSMGQMIRWCSDNCRGEVLRTKKAKFVFEYLDDAMAFRLRWD